MMALLPDFRIPIDDKHAAEFWRQEWWDRYHQTHDLAFREAAEAMGRYMDTHFDALQEDE